MNIIIPMAGLGKRLRPHTLTTAKPLLPIAGKPIVHRLVEDIARVCPEKIKYIGFIVHPTFGKQVEEDLKTVAKAVGAEGKIYYQETALGISHALLFAKELFEGKVIVAFADTLFRADFKLDTSKDGTIWVQKVENPSQFGVVKLNAQGEITELIEKPSTFVSDLAIIGIYFFKYGEKLRTEMQYLLDNDIKEKGEYQFTTALENMKKKGAIFVPGQVQEWLDCGNKSNMVQTNQRYLEIIKDQKLVSEKATVKNSVLLQPVFIADGVIIENSVIGPYVSIGQDTKISDSRISNSIVQKNCSINNAVMQNSLIGNYVGFEGTAADVDAGDYTRI
ncbi:MAG TPA: sugar phosphate nucleotidyltransferase [Cyclobacteriaceae bacterium]|nr:sugar phosphate nucleotidyltransferase [Cyclobacteriaceae bacterium]